ncbi:hypothetical protein POM88_000900 [Heracleum sosnowskyi]|uniref:Thioester reductase (TE) domain-containing protein n=1 Tax=Heracleum sosnowskyi TaxID=360622 RepID=A0AAD8N4G0_9APIA|nr:hypothetical protein POM88_000900 [Heracleum sosnowskyi]
MIQRQLSFLSFTYILLKQERKNNAADLIGSRGLPVSGFTGRGRYDVSLDINTGGPSRVMTLAKKCTKLKLFLQISTIDSAFPWFQASSTGKAHQADCRNCFIVDYRYFNSSGTECVASLLLNRAFNRLEYEDIRKLAAELCGRIHHYDVIMFQSHDKLGSKVHYLDLVMQMWV